MPAALIVQVLATFAPCSVSVPASPLTVITSTPVASRKKLDAVNDAKLDWKSTWSTPSVPVIVAVSWPSLAS